MNSGNPLSGTADANEYGLQPGQNDLGAFRLEDAPNPDATPHRVCSVGDPHRGQAQCQDCGWHTETGDPEYIEKAQRHQDETRRSE